jgi:hypothetical protein
VTPVISIVGVRAAVLAAALSKLPTDTVGLPYGTNLSAVETTLVMVVIDRIEPMSIACSADTAHVDVWLVSHLREPGVADDDLDALHDLTAAGLDTLPHGRRGTTERTVYLDTWPAYRIPMEVSL